MRCVSSVGWNGKGICVMSSSLLQPTLPTPLLVTETRRKQAKASLPEIRKAEMARLWVKWGGCIDEVRGVFRLTLQQFAAELGKDERQVARWVEGKERPQIETVLAVDRFQGAMVIALARLASGVEVDTVIHVRRSA
jgi:hypothetical protein